MHLFDTEEELDITCIHYTIETNGISKNDDSNIPLYIIHLYFPNNHEYVSTGT